MTRLQKVVRPSAVVSKLKLLIRRVQAVCRLVQGSSAKAINKHEEVQQQGSTRPPRRRDLVVRVVKCAGVSVDTDSCRWAAAAAAAAPSCKKGGRSRLIIAVSAAIQCGGEKHCMTESFRVFNHAFDHDQDDLLNVSSSCGDGLLMQQSQRFSRMSCTTDQACNLNHYCSNQATMETSDVSHNRVRSNSGGWSRDSFCPDKGFEVLATYSSNPWSDFVGSMREMMAAFRPADLEAFLDCYLRLNAPIHHPTIALAFLAALASVDPSLPNILHP